MSTGARYITITPRRCRQDVERCRLCHIPVTFNGEHVNPYMHFTDGSNKNILICSDCKPKYMEIYNSMTTKPIFIIDYC